LPVFYGQTSFPSKTKGAIVNIILMGCPGAGKGTQSAKLQETFHLTHISTGDVLRAEIASGSEIGKKIADIISNGNLVPDGLVISLLESLVKKEDGGIIFDGFPRTVAQAEALDEMMSRLQRQITKVIMISLPESEVVGRISSRRQCRKCGGIFHSTSAMQTNVCPVCKGELYTRPDDTPERVKHRLEVYQKETLPVKEYYLRSGKYAEVNGHQTPEQVFESIKDILKKEK